MQTHIIDTDESDTEVEASKTPVIYLAASVKNEVYNTLKEGLSHLNVEVVSEEDFEKAMKRAHMVVMLEDNFDQVKQAWENGVVPITSQFDNSIEDYNPNSESGNAFVFKNNNQWEVFAAIVRATETFKFPYDWKFIVRSAKKAL